MRIDYCPKCNKAGLKYERYHLVKRSEEIDDPEQYALQRSMENENQDNYMKGYKWCHRCQEWVKPENHPYVGARGIR